jgi:zinc/manganese transport system substrate-binding protein
MMTFSKKLAAVTTALGLAFAFTGCTSTEPTDTRPTIVATTNVWADIAGQVAGDKFQVVSLINSASQDPHSYEASAREQLAVKNSELFIMNGGGYDDFALKLASAAEVTPFNVFEVNEAAHAEEGNEAAHAEEGHAHEHAEEGHAHEHAEEGHAHEHDGSDHIWYDLHVAEHTAELIAAELSTLQPDNAAEFKTNAAKFGAEIEVLEERAASITGKLSYFEAHPLATLMFSELGFTNLTPEGFAEAEEAGLEPSVKIMNTASELIKSGKIAFLAVNRQVTSVSLEKLASIAKEQGIPVISFDELLPGDASYQEWFDGLLSELSSLK